MIGNMRRFLIGIDEAGRGPLAGPVSVGAVCVERSFDMQLIPGARDSKKMSEKAREAVFAQMETLKKDGALRFAVAFSSAQVIDSRGIVPAIRSALERVLSTLDVSPDECEVLLDGGLKAPSHFTHQKTIIRGDDSEPVISLASIAAKVSRDRLMRREAQEFPEYGLEVHKGYGTKAHREAIQRLGLSPIHRASFCTALLGRTLQTSQK